MQDQLLIAVFAGLGGMLGWGLADFFAKKTIDKIGDVASLAWGHIFGTGVLLLVIAWQFLVNDKAMAIPYDFKTWLLLIVFGVLQAFVYLFVYQGFGKGQIGILNPVFASFSGITALLSILVFREAVSGYILLGLAILFIGILFISIDPGALRSRRFNFAHVPGFKEIFFATIMAAFWTLFWDKFIGGQDWLSYTFFMYLFMTIAVWVVGWFRKIKLSISDNSVWKFLFLIGAFETGAYLLISLGYSQTLHTSIVALLSGAFSLPTIILAYLFLNEKITKIQRIGTLITVIGIMVLAIL